MPFYEIVYETGRHSVANYKDDAEAAQALSTHHSRAVSGTTSTPTSTPRTDLDPNDPSLPSAQAEWPAERISAVFKYDNHPADYLAGQEISAADLTRSITSMVGALEQDGTVSVPQLAAQIRDLTNPTTLGQREPHDSNYRMEATGQLDPSAWSGTTP